jgi:hypothetical protein
MPDFMKNDASRNVYYFLPLLFGLIGMFAVTLVAAGFLVNSFVITTDVYEPFAVEYAVIGDAGNWDGVTTCDSYTGTWFVGTDVDMDGLYAGEQRLVCTKIVNAGEGAVDYTFSGEVVSGEGNLVECEAAFGNPSVSGTALNGETRNGVLVTVADDATPDNDCLVTLSVNRG